MQDNNIKIDIKPHEIDNIRWAEQEELQPATRKPEPSLKIGTLSGKKVFLKKIDHDSPIRSNRHKRELAVFRTLHELEILTLFKGVTTDENGQLYMVSEFQEGVVFFLDKKMHPYAPSPPFTLKRKLQRMSWLSSLKQMFIKYHIEPQDMQVLISKTTGRIYLIDVEFYQFLGHEIDITTPVLAPAYKPQQLRIQRTRKEIMKDLIDFLKHIQF